MDTVLNFFSQPVIVWLLLLVILVIVELATMGLTTIWFAGGALIAAVLALFCPLISVQIVVFLVVSVMLLIFTRPIAVRYFNKDRIKTNVESLVGKQAIVIDEIDNVQGTGRVTVNGQEWMARSSNNGVKLLVGAVVTIIAINGVKLIVEERRED